MARPKPNVLTEITNKSNYKTDQVILSEGTWAVYYDGKPINLKTFNYLGHGPGPKYKKVSFSNSGPAINLCEKLNKMFKTTKFEVFKLTHGDRIYP